MRACALAKFEPTSPLLLVSGRSWISVIPRQTNPAASSANAAGRLRPAAAPNAIRIVSSPRIAMPQ